MASIDLTSVLKQFADNAAQMNAHLRNMGDSVGEGISGFYREAKRYVRSFDEQRGLRYRPAAITLSAAITGAGVAVSGNDDFRVAQNEDFLCYGIQGFVVNNALQSDIGGAAFTNPLSTTLTPSQVIVAKANNCLLTLQNKDTKVPITENESFPLSSICPEANGSPLRFGPDSVPGFIIPHNMTIQALFALQSANAFFNTASTTYGVILSGLYMSREVR